VLCRLTGCSIEVRENAERICYPNICVSRVKEEFAFAPTRIMDDLDKLVNKYKDLWKIKNDKS